jgi:hypothetical protein
MITEVCVATYELNPAFAETYALEQEDRVVEIVLDPVVSAEQISNWQARVATAIDEELSGERRPRACSQDLSTAFSPLRCASISLGLNRDKGGASIPRPRTLTSGFPRQGPIGAGTRQGVFAGALSFSFAWLAWLNLPRHAGASTEICKGRGL